MKRCSKLRKHVGGGWLLDWKKTGVGTWGNKHKHGTRLGVRTYYFIPMGVSRARGLH